VGNTYRRTANDNIMIVAMIENPAGVEIVEKIAAVPGIDGIFVAQHRPGQLLGAAPG
jgi:2-keto-3-deoxy-L-rhamnonate aldolase RhmA